MAEVSAEVASSGAAHQEQNRAAADNSREHEGQRVMRSDQSYRHAGRGVPWKWITAPAGPEPCV
jgi:hypothetical protein